jgi:hypothetical protein
MVIFQLKENELTIYMQESSTQSTYLKLNNPNPNYNNYGKILGVKEDRKHLALKILLIPICK